MNPQKFIVALLAFIVACFTGYSQELDGYKYIYVETYKYVDGGSDIWGISAQVRQAFADKGFSIINDMNLVSSVKPQDRNAVLYCAIDHTNVIEGYNSVSLILLDLNGNTVLVCSGRGIGLTLQSDYTKATRNALRRIVEMPYHYNPSKSPNIKVLDVEQTEYTETTIKPIIDSQNDGIVGIYQGVIQDDNQYKLACYKVGDNYRLIYISSRESLPLWKVGDVKAELEPTATPAMYTTKWRMGNKILNTYCYVIFEDGSMKTFISGKEVLYVKLYPTASASSDIGGSTDSDAEWSGTGFALKDNYLVTNYHVIKDAKSIWIQGVNGDFNTKHTASVVATDKFNDLALLKIEGVTVNTSDIPYSVKTSTSEVGEDVFVLGYPLTSTMGEEIKLTTGVVSSKTGFQGDVSLYQISAPIQPGNSGGPLFDGNGNVIGIVSAKHKRAENVGYAIKASYLRNLMESALSENILPQTNKIASYKLSEKVKSIKSYVYYISCSSSSKSTHIHSK